MTGKLGSMSRTRSARGCRFYGAGPVHLTITMTKWIHSCRLSIKNSIASGRPIEHTLSSLTGENDTETEPVRDGERYRKRDRQTDRQAERDRAAERDRQRGRKR